MSNPLTIPDLVANLVEKSGLEADLAKLLPPKADALAAAKILLEARQEGAAFRLLAWALPRREAVWWATECVQALLSPDAPPTEQATLEAARAWAAQPSEEHRRKAEQAAQSVNYATPAGQAAVAAFWSGGSMAPPKLGMVPPPEHLLPKACANAVLLAVTMGDPKKVAQHAAQCVELAAAVAGGVNRWNETPSNERKR